PPVLRPAIVPPASSHLALLRHNDPCRSTGLASAAVGFPQLASTAEFLSGPGALPLSGANPGVFTSCPTPGGRCCAWHAQGAGGPPAQRAPVHGLFPFPCFPGGSASRATRRLGRSAAIGLPLQSIRDRLLQ